MLPAFLILQTQATLLIDPLLLAQAAQVWSVTAAEQNPVWPGWNSSDTPMLFYLPGKQDVLVNHPKPPEGFAPYSGPLKLPFKSVYVKNGPTLIEMDGQNTSRDINGVLTLVVADTISNRRQNAQVLSGNPDAQAIENFLTPDPMGSMGLIVHEAFHVYQGRRAPDKSVSEAALSRYPSLSVENNTAFAMEANALVKALRAPGQPDTREAAMDWLALRRFRQGVLGEALTNYEEVTEFNEGLAKYTEYKLFQVLEGKEPKAEMYWLQGFKGFKDLQPERDNLLKQMVEMMSGKVNVNNDPYGASPVRMRLYYSGMGLAALLDKLQVKWHDRIFDPKVSLTTLIAEALGNPDTKERLQQIRSREQWKEVEATKTELEAKGREHIKEVLEGIQNNPHLEFDFSAVEKPIVGFAFTPFGILNIDSDRTVFRLIPITGKVGDLIFRCGKAVPVLQDRKAKHVLVPIDKALSESQIAEVFGPDWRTKPVEFKGQSLQGISFNGGAAKLTLREGNLVITFSAATLQA
jgi:hypothetical protein